MPVATTHPSVVIRSARGSDAAALASLASLDSARALSGPVLVAEVEGRIVAALGTDTGARVADPFERTDGVIALLELRAAATGHGARRRSGARRRLGLAPVRTRVA